MNDKRLFPIIITAVVVVLGLGLLYGLYNNWDKSEINADNSTIEKVDTDNSDLDLKTIIHNTEKNVMQIEGENEDETITGSGFLYNEQGDIITNAHVVKDADIIYVQTANAETYPAAVVETGDDTDIAVIRVPELAGKTYLPVDKNGAEIGDEVIAIGSPHGFQNTVTLGIISGTERDLSAEGFDYDNAYQISNQITHGNSGGPLIRRDNGKVIGINSVGTEDGTIGFSIPIQEVIDQAEEWSSDVQNDDLEFADPEDVGDENDEDQFSEDAAYLIDYFFENITIRDYIGAYTLLGSEEQSSTSYTDFRENYIHTVDLDYSDLEKDKTDENRMEITTDVTIESKILDQTDHEENDDNEDNEEANTEEKDYTYTFTVGNENDQLKIIDMDYTTDDD